MEVLSFFDVLKEADDDTLDAGPATAEAPANDAGGNDDSKASDDDFDIDTSLDAGDDNGTDAPTGSPEDAAEEADGGDDMSTDGGATGEEEENPSDHDIFLSLPKEEQQMKIRELKKQWGNMYTSCVDLCERIDDIDVSDDNKPHLARIYQALSDIKTYIADYIIHIFPSRSYIENDIHFNTFLMLINSIAGILDKIITKENKLRGEEIKDNYEE